MPYNNLRDFIKVLEEKGELQRIMTVVDSYLEITEITDRVVKSKGPALLFQNVRGSRFPVLINAFGSQRRMNLALGVESLEEIAERILSFLKPELPSSIIDKMKKIPKLMEVSDFFPKIVSSGPCQEVVVKDKPSLNTLPILHCWPQDGGRYITMPLVISKDPVTKVRNIGMYRMQVFDERTTGMHWHMHKGGASHYQKYSAKQQKMEVAVAIGVDPATIYSATAPLPANFDEFIFASFLRKKPLELVRAKTVDLEVPAQAEFILEGYVLPDEKRLEGPFGDHTGYYSQADEYPVFHLTCITHRQDGIYNATIVGRPPMEDCFIAKATERIFLPLLKLLYPEIIDMNLPLEGVFHNCAIISIKKSYPGHGRKVMHGFWGLGQLMFTKIIIIVDSDVDVQDLSEVAWKVMNNLNPKEDVVITEGPLDILDNASPYLGYGSKLGIDATKKWSSEGRTREWMPEITMTGEVKNLVEEKWASYGFKG